MKNLLLLSFLVLALSAFAMPQDSIGIKVIDGKTYIMHKVTKGEGVYGIGKKYGVPASEIFAANEGSEKSIKIDQVLLIPKSGLSTASGNSDNSGSRTSTKTEKIYHVVAKGQTLSSIAREHKTTVAEIKQLNNLKSDNISLGQKLIVGETKTTVTNTGTGAAPVKQEPKPETKPEPSSTTPSTIPTPTSNNVVVKANVEEKPMDDKPGQVVNTYSTDDGDEVTESGIAVISEEGDLSQERSFILHPTAKIGTIVMITNPENNSTVFARVVGNCKAEQGIILKMSKTVASKLELSQNSVVKLSYAK
ncbi:MAG TPA: LysM peptidoglycan-binding domain-containing protein [Bacteroidia bacterium]